MKLLTPLANKEVRQNEDLKKIIRAKELDDVINKKNIELARSEADFNATLARNRAKWALEEEEHAKRLKDMEAELKPLEQRKQQALIPIEVYKQQADVKMLEAEKYLQTLLTREAEIDDLKELLDEKLTEVSDRENQVAMEEKRQKNALLGIETQQEETKKGVQRLSEDMIMFHEKQEREEASLLQRKKEVTLAEISFKAKTDKLKRDIEALNIRELQVKDERETLQREFDRLKFPPIKTE